MVLTNDYVLKLFNGDIGICLPDDGGELMVWFPEQDAGFPAGRADPPAGARHRLCHDGTQGAGLRI
jgi:exodeoxyribonuclease V alpha subunit